MKNCLVVFLCSLFSLVLAACPDVNINSGEHGNNPGSNTNSKYAKEYLGEWIRMDTGERWYISGNTISINGITTNKNVTFTKTAEQVITVKETGSQDYLLFASRVADASFNVRVVLLNGNINNSSRSLVGNDGKRPPIMITNPQQPEQPSIVVTPDPDTGEIEVPGQIPGDKIIIVPDDPQWNDIIVELIPWDEQNMGIIPLTKGVNLKASIRMANPLIDISELYADGTSQNYIFEIENIGDANCIGASYEISWDESDFNLISGNKIGTLDTIIPGGKKQISMTLASKAIVNEYKNKEIKVTIVSYNLAEQTTVRWEDTVSVNYYRESVPFRFKSQRPVQGVVRSPRNKTYYFKTSGTEGNYTATLNLPWLSDDYVVAFLGASVSDQSETKYSIAIDSEPRSDWESLWGEDMFQYEAVNKSPNTAPTLSLASNEFMYYLYTGAVQFFKLNLGSGITLDKYHLNLPVGESEKISATVHPKNTASQSVIWASSNPAVANVDGSGNVTAVAAGTAKITATSVACNKVSESVVNVYEINYTVTYNKNAVNATGTMNNSSHTGNENCNLELNTFFNTGYTFEGWATSPTGNVVYTDGQNVSNLTYKHGATVTLYAIWTGINYTVVYNANGGTGVMEDSNFIYNETKNLRKNVFTRIGYVFIGWSTTATSSVVYNNEQNVINLSTTVNGIITLYAVWDSSLSAQLTWLKESAVSNTEYTILIRADENINPFTFSFDNKENIKINIISEDSRYVINCLSNNEIFILNNGITLILGKNITLKGTIKINDGNLIMNEGANTGGIHVTKGTFIMNGGTISGDNGYISYYIRSGVYIDKEGTFIMNNGEISSFKYTYLNGSNYNGGGVYVLGTFIMYNGQIKNNSRGDSAGGVAVFGNFTLYDGKITGNTAEYGAGGVYVDGGGNFIMYGGEISNNSAKYGGGVYITFATFRLINGSIINNTASSLGRSIYFPMRNNSIAQYGKYNENIWISNGDFDTTNNNIRVENGVLK